MADRSVTRRWLDRDLPSPVFAVVGLIDAVTGNAGALVGDAARVPGQVWHAVGAQYEALVRRGHERVIEEQAQRAVRLRAPGLPQSVVRRSGPAAVRWNDRRLRWQASANGRRTRRAGGWVTRRVVSPSRTAAARFAERNAPVLLDPNDAPADHS